MSTAYKGKLQTPVRNKEKQQQNNQRSFPGIVILPSSVSLSNKEELFIPPWTNSEFSFSWINFSGAIMRAIFLPSRYDKWQRGLAFVLMRNFLILKWEFSHLGLELKTNPIKLTEFWWVLIIFHRQSGWQAKWEYFLNLLFLKNQFCNESSW